MGYRIVQIKKYDSPGRPQVEINMELLKALIAEKLSNREIGRRMGISHMTVARRKQELQ